MQAIKKLLALRLAGPFDLAHALLLLTFAATVAIPDLVKAEDLLGFSQYAAATLKVGTYLSGLLMLLKQFSPAPVVADSIEEQASKLRPLSTLMMLGALVLALAGCGAGQIFGPGSPLPGDLQAEENCVAGQLLSGNTDPVAVLGKCGIPEGKLATDLFAYLLDALGIKIPVLGRQSVGAYVTAKRAAGQP